jgi:hypothetical protein
MRELPMIRRLAVCLFLLLFVSAAFAETSPAVPSPEEFLGHKLGERFTSWEQILGYFDELAKRSNLIAVQRIGETYEGRPLVLATITSAKNRVALDAIRGDVASLANAAVDGPRATSIARTTPAVVWLAFGVHGNESSSSEAAMEVASTLLRDPEAQRLLDDVIVVIDPLQNPDGRERYVQWYKRTRGVSPSANPQSFEHVEPWPGGRFNHYLIDMNRDWAWSSQQETRARIAQYRQWNPQVFVDFHEMGSNSTYFFPPDAKPLNANLPRELETWLGVFGRANAEAFTGRGWPFFVGEVFDLFYPAYGDSWPSLHGAIGMTYEVAGGGRAGTIVDREDQTKLTLAHRIEQHYTTAMTTLRTAAAHREALLRYMYDSARAQTEGGKAVYFILRGSPSFEPLVAMLQRNGIRVETLSGPLTTRATRVTGSNAESRTFPAGTAVVTTRQPLGRLAQTLLEKSPVFTQGFLEAQRARAQADEPDEFYDVTAWALPLAMNVEAFTAAAPINADMKPYQIEQPPPFRAAAYGYLVDALDPNVYRFAGQLLASGSNFSVSEDAVVVGDRTFDRGTLIILKGNNKPDLDATLTRISAETGAPTVPLESGWTGGTAFGSEKIHYVRDPKIALVGGPGVSATSYGMLWHTLDIDSPIPHTTLALDSLANTDLSDYRVIVLPDGQAYADRLGKRGLEKLQAWIREGGTVVAIGRANAFLRAKDVEVSKLKPWEPPKVGEEKPAVKDDPASAPQKEERYNEYRVPGAAFATTMNERSFLTFGVPRPPAVLIEGSTAYRPVAHKVDNILTIPRAEALVAGVAWPESIERVQGSVVVVSEPYGRGNVITFANDPHFRLFWRATLPLFLNAVLYSPSFPRGSM